MMHTLPPQQAKALARYQVVSGYLAVDPPRGRRRRVLEQLARRIWTGPDGEPFQVAAETIRVWVRRYRRGGLAALEDKPRPLRGTKALSAEVVDLACALKREVPERSLDRVVRILEGMGHVEPGVVRRSTLHRVLQRAGLSARPVRGSADRQDLDRFEADHPNDLWQSDMLVGPWLPDPFRPGKVRRAYLYTFLDDHSRLVLHGRFSFKGDLPALELVFRRSLQKYGIPRRVYYDNGQVYRSRHMAQIVAHLGMHRVVFTQPYRPQGHGKIEALNRLIRSAFISELKASRITTLDELNEAWVAWADLEYNRTTHGETGQAPRDRWRAGIERVAYADEAKLRQAFLWHERRTADKAGVFSLFGTRYQVGAALANRRIELRYDPEVLDEVEVWHDGRFVERVTPFEVRTHRRARPKSAEPSPAPKGEERPAPTANWLGHLVGRRHSESFLDLSPRKLSEEALARRAVADQAIVDLLNAALDEAVFNEASVRDFLARYGPLDATRAAVVLERTVATCGHTHHVTVYLDAIRAAAQGERP